MENIIKHLKQYLSCTTNNSFTLSLDERQERQIQHVVQHQRIIEKDKDKLIPYHIVKTSVKK